MYAAKSGNHEKVERLLKERGADPNTIDIDMVSVENVYRQTIFITIIL